MVNTVITAVFCAWLTALALGVAVMWLTGPMRARRRQLTDPEDYTRRARYPAKRAEDELAAQERAERIAKAREDWS